MKTKFNVKDKVYVYSEIFDFLVGSATYVHPRTILEIQILQDGFPQYKLEGKKNKVSEGGLVGINDLEKNARIISIHAINSIKVKVEELKHQWENH